MSTEPLLPWSLHELIDALAPASEHVRKLLGELARNGESTLEATGCPPVAVALVGRICQGRGRESLLLRDNTGGQTLYALDPRVAGMTATALAFDGRVPRRRPRTKPRRDATPSNNVNPRSGRGDSSGADARPAEQVEAVVHDGDAIERLRLPRDASFEFAMTLVRFLQRTTRTPYFIVYDGADVYLNTGSVPSDAPPSEEKR